MSNEIEILQKIKIENNKDFEIPEGFSANIGELKVEEGIKKTLTPGRYTFDGNEIKRLKQNFIDEIIIKDLFNKSFLVESYQRGYKWTDIEVKALLNDIYNFDESESNKFYCLQPIVVKRNKDKWELIDGQQRLTTIYIILSFSGKEKFYIEYKTRLGSSHFLNKYIANQSKINTDDWNNFIDQNKDLDDIDNIDNYHFFEAYKTIKNWFADEKRNEEIFYQNLTEKTKIIWYEVNDEPSPTKIFQRINIGKIPLTNAELIKALFLKDSNYEDKNEREELAREWDRIEYTLHNEEFWYYLTGGKINTPTRIEFIFKLILENENKKQNLNKDDKYFIFREFDKLINDPSKSYEKNKTLHKEYWKKVRDYIRTFEEWFEDKELYHLIGYLIVTGHNLHNIYEWKKAKSRSNFKIWLKSEIKEKISTYLKNKNLSELFYGQEDLAIRNILLLFNIQTILNSDTNYRFPFDKFIKEKWSLEHIHAQNSENLRGLEHQQAWLKESKEIIEKLLEDKDNCKLNEENDLIEVIDNYNKLDKSDQEEFINLFNRIVGLFGGIKLHDITNLALLDRNSNSSLNNAIFPKKREKILEFDKKPEKLIPQCTKNVFLKRYTKEPRNMYFWTEEDRNAYITAIKETLKEYLQENSNESQGEN